MAPLVAALAQSESKEKFLRRLNLAPNDRRADELYDKMKSEAELGCRRMADENRSQTTANGARLLYDPSLANESTKYREIQRIYQLAAPETKRIYDLGHDVQSHSTENWVIRWMLWHVCRYISAQIQYRHTAKRRSVQTPRAPNNSNHQTNNGPNHYWDPVRDR